MQNFCEICTQRTTNDCQPSEILSAFLNFYSETAKMDDEKSTLNFCPLCLGLLDPKFCRRVIMTLKEKLDFERYDALDCNFCVSYPISVIIRERLFEIYSKNIESSFAENGLKRFKDFVKLCYKAVLEDFSRLKTNPESDFTINVNFSHEVDDIEGAKIAAVFADCLTTNKNKKRKKKRAKLDNNESSISRSNLFAVLPQLNSDLIEKFNVELPPKSMANCCTFEIVLERQPLFIGGRYLKFSRYVNQTPWMVDGVLKSKASVQELLSDPFLNAIKCDEVKFSASGREDADVRMLGDGRPFVLQFINPRRKLVNADVKKIENSCNNMKKQIDDVKAVRLCVVTSKEFELLKQGEEEKRKHYSALCYSRRKIDDDALKKLNETINLQIVQKTPIRVLHRRPLHDRRRSIDSMRTLRVDDFHFQLFLVTQAGTYVKEFVHGDFGRTRPSLSGLLGVPVDILELDVEKVDLDWPPPTLC